MAAGKKRQLEDTASAPKPKKTKVASGEPEKKEKKARSSDKPLKTTTKAAVNAPVAAPEEVDFPRGGGSALTPYEIKSARVEAVKEANEELFKVCMRTTIVELRM